MQCCPSDFSPITQNSTQAGSTSTTPPTIRAGSRRHILKPRQIHRIRTTPSRVIKLLLPILCHTEPLQSKSHSQTFQPPFFCKTCPSNQLIGPKHFTAARKQNDSAEWSAAHDNCIDCNIRLGAWDPVPADQLDSSLLVTLMLRYCHKTNPYGSFENDLHDAQFAVTS